MSGQSIHIDIDFSDDTNLKEVMLSVKRVHDDVEVYHQHAHPNTLTHSFEVDSILTTTMHSDLRLPLQLLTAMMSLQ